MRGTGPGAALAAAWMTTAWVVAPLGAQDPAEPLVIPRLGGEVRVDGPSDEPAWARVDPLPLTLYAPVFEGEPTQDTEIRVAHDDEALYLAGRFWDDDPAAIRVNSLYRDRWSGDDAFAVYVDAFNDNRTAKWFGVTPAGMRFDHLVSDDGATLNRSWDGVWEAESVVTGEGWFAELRIPFSTLGFQAGSDGTAVMGLTVTRLVSRLAERVTFPAIDPRFQFRQPSRARDVALRGVSSPRPVYLTPYVLAGRERRAVPGEVGGPWSRTSDDTRDVGVDLRYAVTGNLTLDLTANTDFAQVEADDQLVNLDRFPLFFPEKRRFFQEGSGIFDFATGGGGRLFHSRRIGLTDDREPVPVLGGARLVGRVGEWDVGLLDVQTRDLEAGSGGAADAPGENFAVARFRRRVMDDVSTVGLMATRRAAQGRSDLALGVDGAFRIAGEHYLDVKWAATRNGSEPGDHPFAEESLWNVRWQRRVNRGLAYTLEWIRAGEGYDPRVGFLPRRDFTSANILANWYFFTDDHSLFRRVWPGMLAFSTFRNGDGSLESGQYAVWLQWETKAGGGGWIEPKLFRDDVAAAFPLGDAEVPAGDYTYADLQLYWSMPAGSRLRTSVDARAGTFFDGTRVQVVLGPTWNLSRHLELGADYQYSRIRFEDRNQATDIHVGRVRVRTALDARASGNAFVQYDSVSDRLALNLRLRYNFAEGTDLWLVWDEGLSTDRSPGDGGPLSPRSLSRSFVIKYTHTLGFGF